MKKILLISLTLIVFLATFLRFYKLDKIPPSLNWDEVAAGYNAYTIANWGADEYGEKFPIVFKSFADDKHPVHIYLTSLVVKIFGLTDFSTRASSALVGTLAVLAVYFLAKELFRSDLVGIFSSLFLAVSPYHLHFSRGLWEANFALSFLIIAIALFYLGIRKKSWLIPMSFICFGLSFFSYHSAKVVVPPVGIFLCLIYFKNILKNKKVFVFCILIISFFAILIIKDRRILGFARVNQTRFSEKIIQENDGIIPTYIQNYKGYFTYNYLFQKGDQGPRASVKIIGQFYKIDLLLVIIGILVLLIEKRWEALLLIGIWLGFAPIPGALSSLEPSAVRGIFLIGPMVLLSGRGAGATISILRNKWLRIIGILVLTLFLGREINNYLNYYYHSYSTKEAIEWQYGMKQIVEYLKSNPDYIQVYMDKIRQQPYIFFLYYFKTPLPDLLKSVRYDESGSKSYNTVFSFGKYQFGGWNIVESYPNYKVLYIVTPSYYTGLRYINEFSVQKLIKYPDGTDAFYIVEGGR